MYAKIGSKNANIFGCKIKGVYSNQFTSQQAKLSGGSSSSYNYVILTLFTLTCDALGQIQYTYQTTDDIQYFNLCVK